jgi:hypothetical protein
VTSIAAAIMRRPEQRPRPRKVTGPAYSESSEACFVTELRFNRDSGRGGLSTLCATFRLFPHARQTLPGDSRGRRTAMRILNDEFLLRLGRASRGPRRRALRTVGTPSPRKSCWRSIGTASVT